MIRLPINHVTGATAAIVTAATLLVAPGAAAQPRGGRHGAAPARVIVAPPIYYYGYGLYDPFWGSMWSPYDGWYGPAFYEGVAAHDPDESAARLQVKPKNAEVYIDGYLAGTVDNFDGALQRLNVPPGEHTLTFYLDGYQTFSQKVVFRPHATLNIKYEMQKLAAGQTSGPRPEPTEQPEAPAQAPRLRGPGRAAGTGPVARRSPAGEFGTLSIRVQPRDAQVIVDGQQWETSGSGPLTIELSEGPHEIEVRQDGFAPFRRTVQIRAANTTSLNVSLSR